MKNQIYRIVAILAIFLGLGAVSVHAQAPSKVEVNIPFEFSAGKTTLQPGVYSIKRMSGNNVRLRSEDGKSSVILNAPVTHTSSDPEAVERLVFERYGEQFALSQIWLTADTGRQIWTEKKSQSYERIVIAFGQFARK
ncbi:MAG TPA: hypothetical protein VKB02_00735 [Pyrinomonadaceae bacterium]|nr:hypothetical protein [Pyrinomonadaceae bacterium]